MPTISLQRDDLEALIAGPGEKPSRIPLDQLEQWLMLVKGELKGHNTETGELRVELQDSNRPDLWCCEGIARQIRIKQQGAAISYSFFKKQKRVAGKLVVAPGLDRIRPYVAACTAVGYRVTASGLTQLIQTQEKLADIFGRKRRSVSIGLYRLAPIVFPVSYDLVKPDEVRFTPLGMETVMTLREILMVHPKGVEYGGIVGGHVVLFELSRQLDDLLMHPESYSDASTSLIARDALERLNYLERVLAKSRDALSIALSDVEWRASSPTQKVIFKAHAAIDEALK